MVDVGNDIVAIAQIGAEAAYKLLIIQLKSLVERAASLLEGVEERAPYITSSLVSHIVELLFLNLHGVKSLIAGGTLKGTATIGKRAAQYQCLGKGTGKTHQKYHKIRFVKNICLIVISIEGNLKSGGERGEKLNHFARIKEIRKAYKETVDNEIRRIIEVFNPNNIREIIFNIDIALPDDLKASYALSEERKELIYRLIINRFNRLKEVLL